jgi:iron complex outermembrane receptor protein
MKHYLLCATSLLVLSTTAHAQTSPTPPPPVATDSAIEDIIVIAQRQSERLQDVPIAVSAFSAEALQTQQINNANDLQLALPNVTFTKGNFTAASFTIRGVGDLCVGSSCDSATAIHVNDIPLLSTRLFETEYFDLERVEVLRGPQGTLYGRNATSGVANFITAKPDLTGFHASGEVEYGNYESIKAQGMINVPIGESLGVRVAGYYLKRDGFTRNLYDNSRIDGRDLYAIRGSLRWQPTSDTTIDLMGYYFREKDDRSRIQKQLCNRDPTAVLGCSPDRLGFDTTNANSTLSAALSSRQLFAVASLAQGGALGNLGISNLLSPTDIFAGVTNPTDLRTVSVDYRPTYVADELQLFGRLEQGLGRFNLTLTGGYARNSVDARTDYTLSVANPYSAEAVARAGLAAATFPASLAPVFRGGQFCVSEPNKSLNGVFGGNVAGCSNAQIDFDRSRGRFEQWSAEAQIASDLDGIFNFRLGGIYVKQVQRDVDYYVSSTGIDYGAAVLGGAQAGNGLFLGPPFFANQTSRYALKSYGLFGEAYLTFNDRLKLTLGARYSNDDKTVASRSPIAAIPAPVGSTDLYGSPLAGAPSGTGFFGDADLTQPGYQPFRSTSVKFDDVTGRAVLDFKISPDNLLYASYSRGYKSGGINPPVDPTFVAPLTFEPENIDAYEIGSKNSFLNGQVRLNASAFYYKYKNLQISRILNRTSFNDNTDATIYGAELEAIVAPTPRFVVNISASYLHTKIKDLSLADPRDPSGGRSDVTIIKDVQTASNCVLIPTGSANGSALVGAVNAFLNGATGAANGGPLFQSGTVPVPGTNARGAISSCQLLAAAVAGAPYAPGSTLAALGPVLQAFGFAPGTLGFSLDSSYSVPTLPLGVSQSVAGNELPGSPNFKVAIGAQYTFDLRGGASIVLRGDYNYTGEFYSRPQNSLIDRIPNFEQINAQIRFNGPNDRYFARIFVQNLQNNDSITGQFLTDPAAGLYTNIFTLEPRRYGASIGFKF